MDYTVIQQHKEEVHASTDTDTFLIASEAGVLKFPEKSPKHSVFELV